MMTSFDCIANICLFLFFGQKKNKKYCEIFWRCLSIRTSNELPTREHNGLTVSVHNGLTTMAHNGLTTRLSEFLSNIIMIAL